MASKSRTGIKVFIVVLILALLAGGAVLFLRPVAQVATVTGGKAYEVVPGSVTVVAERVKEIKSKSGGKIARSNVKMGTSVKTGDVLIQMDTADLALEIAKTESDYDAAKKRVSLGSMFSFELANAQSDLENAERLHRTGNMSEADLNKQRRSVQQIEQKRDLEKVGNDQLIQGLENTLATERRALADMTVSATFDGQVNSVLYREDDLIGQGATIGTVISADRKVEARISEENFSGIKIGQKATVRFLGYGNQFYDATVSQIYPSAEPDTQRYVVLLDVKIDKALLFPGITGEVNIVVNERDAKTIIPRRALVGYSVFVVKDGIVEQRNVTRGFVSNTDVEIVNGLEPGEDVIVEEQDRFRTGDHVRVKMAK